MAVASPSGLNLRTPIERNVGGKPPINKSNKLFMIAGIAVIALALIGIIKAVGKANSAAAQVPVVVAAKDLLPGLSLGYTEVRFLQIPKRYVTADMISSPSKTTGRILRSFVAAGEPILASNLFPVKDGLSSNLKADERAITIQLNDDTLVDHSIQPDDRIDVLVITDTEGKKYTKTLCQNIRVLMAPSKRQTLSRFGHGAQGNKITLAVKPEQAEEITEASEVGKLRLLLCARTVIQTPNLYGSDIFDCVPHFAIKDLKHEQAPEKLAQATSANLPSPPPMTVPVNPDKSASAADDSGSPPPPPAFSPAWLVEVLTGSSRKQYDVPSR